MRIGLRRWYVAVPAGIIVLLASLVVRSSVALEYKSTGSLLLFAPRDAVVAQNPLLGFNSLHVPASVTAQVVSSLETRERLVARGASENYEVGLDPSNPAPLVIAVAIGGREEARRTVELVLAEVEADLERRQEGLGAPPETWITTEVVTPPTRPIAQAGARTRAFIAAVMVGSALAAGLTLLADLLLSRRGRTSGRREPDATDEPAPEAPVPAPAGASRPAAVGRQATTAAPVPAPPGPPAPAGGPETSSVAPHPAPTPNPSPTRNLTPAPAARAEPGPAVPGPAAARPGAPHPAPTAPATVPVPPPERVPHVPASLTGGPPAPARRPAAPAPPPQPATPAASSPPPQPAAAASPGSPTGSPDSGHGVIPVRRRHPYLVAREDEAPADENGQAPARKSGTD
ncbi:MAG: hypothetical protein ACLGIO_07970 [Acidimicrobiia bacterium]